MEVYTSDFRSAAADYRKRCGWSVIPLRGKVPTEPWAWYRERRPTLEEIGRSEWPGVGVVTGSVSGIVVLDADSERAVEELRRLGHPATPMAKTARGVHLYFKHPGGELPTRIGLGDGIDLKADGGYVVAPPSRHPSGASYEWIISPEDAAPADLPAWVAESLERHGRKPKAEDVGEEIADGSRNRTLFSIAGTLRRRGLDEAGMCAALLGINAEKCRPPLDESEVRRIARSAARYEPADARPEPNQPHGNQPPRFNLTDLGNAERLVARHGRGLRYVHPWGKWLAWDGARWKMDAAGEVERRAKETVRSIYAEAGDESDDARRRALVEHAKRSEARSRIEAMIALARSEQGIPAQPDELDADPWLLNVENGTIDLRSGELRKPRRGDLITKLAPVEYDPDAQAPRFERFLREVLIEDPVIGFLRRFAGYSLTGSTRERVFTILWGRGKNGKSTLVELLRDALGDYATNTDVETILRKKHAGVGNDVAALRGARFVSSAEVEQGRALAESKVKNLTGSDTVTARFLFKEPFDFRPEFKLWLSTNNKPIIGGTDDAIWDRIRLVPFTQRFEGDRADAGLPDTLREELPGVLAWMVRGCLEWLRGGLGEPERVIAATAGYRAEMDTLAAFIEDECVVRPGVWVTFADLYATYTRWCEESNEHLETRRRFGTLLAERGFEPDTGSKNVAIRRGIALRSDGGPDPSRVNDDPPDPGPRDPEGPPKRPADVNRFYERDEMINPQNACKPEDYGEGFNEGYPKSNTFGEIPYIGEGCGKTLTSLTSLTHGPSPAAILDDSDEQPEWLIKQLPLCANEPVRYLDPTASALAAHARGEGSPTEAEISEAREALEAYLARFAR